MGSGVGAWVGKSDGAGLGTGVVGTGLGTPLGEPVDCVGERSEETFGKHGASCDTDPNSTPKLKKPMRK